MPVRNIKLHSTLTLNQKGPLADYRTEQCDRFQVIGVDYAGTIFFRSKTRKDLKTFYCFHAVLAELRI